MKKEKKDKPYQHNLILIALAVVDNCLNISIV